MDTRLPGIATYDGDRAVGLIDKHRDDFVTKEPAAADYKNRA